MLLSNSLFLDSEYKADCENKINYLEDLDSNNSLVRDVSELYKEDSDGILFPLKQISGSYKKLILDTDYITIPDENSENSEKTE